MVLKGDKIRKFNWKKDKSLRELGQKYAWLRAIVLRAKIANFQGRTKNSYEGWGHNFNIFA